MSQLLDAVDAASSASDVPDFRPGDTVKVHVNIVEGTRSRIQVFQGVVIGRPGDGVRETFTVRKVSFQVGVERTFPVHSPVIDHIEVVTRGDVRRAKLYYLRELRGKKAKIKEKRDALDRARARVRAGPPPATLAVRSSGRYTELRRRGSVDVLRERSGVTDADRSAAARISGRRADSSAPGKTRRGTVGASSATSSSSSSPPSSSRS